MFAFRNLLALPLAPTGNILIGLLSQSTLIAPSSFPATNLLIQRWKHRVRKPIGSPRSRKKRYYVRVPTPIIPEEWSELFWRWNHYRTEMRSLKGYFREWKGNHYPMPAVTAGSATQALDEDFKQVLAENDEINALVAVARETRRAQELALQEEYRLEDLTEWENRVAENLEVRKEQIRRKEEAVANMVTPENLQERLEKAYDNPISYDFCIFPNGRRVYGRPDPLNGINMAFTRESDLITERPAEAMERNVAVNE